MLLTYFKYCLNLLPLVDWKLYAWIKRGKRRKEILHFLSNSNQPVTPKEIKDELKISLSQVSLLLKELTQNKLILCLNPEDNIGKLYTISEDGKRLMDGIKK